MQAYKEQFLDRVVKMSEKYILGFKSCQCSHLSVHALIQTHSLKKYI